MAIGGSGNLVLITGKRKYKRQDDLYGSRRNWGANKTKNEILVKKIYRIVRCFTMFLSGKQTSCGGYKNDMNNNGLGLSYSRGRVTFQYPTKIKEEQRQEIREKGRIIWKASLFCTWLPNAVQKIVMSFYFSFKPSGISSGRNLVTLNWDFNRCS